MAGAVAADAQSRHAQLLMGSEATEMNLGNVRHCLTGLIDDDHALII